MSGMTAAGVPGERAAWRAVAVAALALGAALSAGCGGGDGETFAGLTTTDLDLRGLIAANGLDGDPTPGDAPAITDPRAQLGMRLFFTKSMSLERDTACASCHHPALGGGDDLTLPIGVEAVDQNRLGPGRLHSPAAGDFDGGPTVPRNSPTIFVMSGWRRALFHDGRVERIGGGGRGGIRTPDTALGVADPQAGPTLSGAQARFPVTSPEEMKGHRSALTGPGVRTYLAERLGGYGTGGGDLATPGYWVDQFRTAFNRPGAPANQVVTYENAQAAIGDYMNAQNFVDAPWRAYVRGDNAAISEQAKQGALVFFRPVGAGGAGCASCHAGDLFSDEAFHNIAMPQIGRGKGDGVNAADDFGRFRETGNPDDLYAFRTPTLWNVTATGPWGHSGAYTTLEGVVRHHLDPVAASQDYDPTQLTQPGIQNLASVAQRATDARNKLIADRIAGRPVIQDAPITDAQVAQVLAFLETLTDPCVEDPSCTAPFVPPAAEDPNGDQLEPTFSP